MNNWKKLHWITKLTVICAVINMVALSMVIYCILHLAH